MWQTVSVMRNGTNVEANPEDIVVGDIMNIKIGMVLRNTPHLSPTLHFMCRHPVLQCVPTLVIVAVAEC